MKLFGKKKKAPSPQESIMKLRETSEMLEKREAFLQQKADAETVKAKQMLQAKNKRGFTHLFIQFLNSVFFSRRYVFKTQEELRGSNRETGKCTDEYRATSYGIGRCQCELRCCRRYEGRC